MVENRGVRAAVVGHVEWVEFIRVERMPARDQIETALESWEEAGGGGGVAAARFTELAEETVLFTALGDDEDGRAAHEQLGKLGVRVEVAWRATAQRRAVVFLDETGERAITVIGERDDPLGSDALPWYELARMDAVYFTAGDRAALEHARAAPVLVATARELPLIAHARVRLDALVGSGSDEKEAFAPAELDPAPGLAVVTSGALGGWMHPGGPYTARPLPGPREDSYGCGDSFAAGLAIGLGRGDSAQDAVDLAASCGAAALTRKGALGAAAT